MATRAVTSDSRPNDSSAGDDVFETSFAGQSSRENAELRKVGRNKELRQLSTDDLAEDHEDEVETSCGIGGCRPRWIQRFARAEVYAAVHGILGFMLHASTTYFNGTLSTIEKHLKIPSKTSGFIRTGFEVGVVTALPVMGYAARHVRPMRLLATGAALVAVSSVSFALPYFVFGAGADARALAAHAAAAASNATAANFSANVLDAMCHNTPSEDCSEHSGIIGDESFMSSAMLYVTILVMGIGCSAHFSVGLAYLDNNSSKNMAPILLALTACVQMVGPTLGFWVAAIALKFYIDPSITPPFTNEDPRWVGAWWMGLPLLGVLTGMVSIVVMLFPRRLPRAAARRRQLVAAGEVQEAPAEAASLQDFKRTLRRLLSNKVFVFNTCSTLFLMFGYEGYFLFMSKYIETQYRQTASQANVITGSVGLVFTGVGTMAAALVITKFKPRPRTLAAWNVVTELIDVLGHFTWAFVGCVPLALHGSLASDGSWNLTAPCNADCGCGPEVKFAPVCSSTSGTTFFSACHAGCNLSESFSNETKVFTDCACVAEGIVSEGPCATDCAASFMVFIVMRCLLTFLQATGRSGNALLAFRCVEERDKSFSIALTEFALSIVTFFPAAPVYGVLLDIACVVWGVSCGETGHCWLYDEKLMRYLLNFISAGSLLGGLIFDVLVWVYCPGLKVYDEDHNVEAGDRAETASFLEMQMKDKEVNKSDSTHTADKEGSTK